MLRSLAIIVLAARAFCAGVDAQGQTSTPTGNIPNPPHQAVMDETSGLAFSDLAARCAFSPTNRPALAGYQCAVGKLELTQFADYVEADTYVVMQEQEWAEKTGFPERHFALFVSDRPDKAFHQIIAIGGRANLHRALSGFSA